MADGSGDTLNITLAPGLAGVSRVDWDALANPDGERFDPFISYDFLDALEASHCVGEKAGWVPWSMLMFSASPGQVARDGAGQNSAFSLALAKHLPTPGAEILTVMKRVIADVKSETAGVQVPMVSNNLTTEIVLKAGSGGDAGAIADAQEQALFEALTKARPGYSFLGEERGLKASTVAAKLNCICGMYRFAHLDGHLAMDPAAHVRRPKVQFVSSTNGVSRSQLADVLNNVQKKYDKYLNISRVDIKKSPELAKAQGVTKTPHVIVFSGNEKIYEFQGPATQAGDGQRGPGRRVQGLCRRAGWSGQGQGRKPDDRRPDAQRSVARGPGGQRAGGAALCHRELSHRPPDGFHRARHFERRDGRARHDPCAVPLRIDHWRAQDPGDGTD